MVKKELDILEADAKVYKLIGSVLVYNYHNKRLHNHYKNQRIT
jgi:chaperonin cofactor prefoldin